MDKTRSLLLVFWGLFTLSVCDSDCFAVLWSYYELRLTNALNSSCFRHHNHRRRRSVWISPKISSTPPVTWARKRCGSKMGFDIMFHILIKSTWTKDIRRFDTTLQWRIQDFPEGGAWTLQGGREHAKFSRKLHEIERIWTPRGGRASLTPPLDPPMHLVTLVTNSVTKSTRL